MADTFSFCYILYTPCSKQCILMQISLTRSRISEYVSLSLQEMLLLSYLHISGAAWYAKQLSRRYWVMAGVKWAEPLLNEKANFHLRVPVTGPLMKCLSIPKHFPIIHKRTRVKERETEQSHHDSTHALNKWKKIFFEIRFSKDNI